MIRLAQVIETFGADLLAQYGNRLTRDPRRALAAIRDCRGPASPRLQVPCPDCAHAATLYERLLRCAWQTVETFSRNDRPLSGTPGAIAGLHTNTRRLDYHPHVPLVMPAAAVDGKSQVRNLL